jgi:5-methylcytosine-specific restriction protein A
MPIQETERLRGRAAVKRRARWLELHPLCAECDKEGQVTAGQVVDHITPLWKGGADDYEANGQTLCNPHHDAKSKAEAAERARGG